MGRPWATVPPGWWVPLTTAAPEVYHGPEQSELGAPVGYPSLALVRTLLRTRGRTPYSTPPTRCGSPLSRASTARVLPRPLPETRLLLGTEGRRGRGGDVVWTGRSCTVRTGSGREDTPWILPLSTVKREGRCGLVSGRVGSGKVEEGFRVRSRTDKVKNVYDQARPCERPGPE